MLTRINEFPGLFPLEGYVGCRNERLILLGVSILRVVEVRLAGGGDWGWGIEVGEETETGDFFF